MVTVNVLELPVAATAISLVAIPGREAGVKLTVPSSDDVAIDVWRASSCGCAHRPRAGQGGAHA